MKNKFKIIWILLFLFSLTYLYAVEKNTIKDGMDISWEFIGNDIEFIITADTLGWVAIGFEPSKVMKDADIIIGYVEDGMLYIEDHYGNGFISHKIDTSQDGTNDVVGISGSETDASTTISFKIPQNSGDSKDKVLVEGQTYKVILAYGKKDNFKTKHSYRSSIMLKL